MPAQPSQVVHLPNGNSMHSSHTASLQLHPSLPETASKAHIFPTLQSPLISVGHLCDNGCNANFSATGVEITYQDTTIINGYRNPRNSLGAAPTPIINSLLAQPPVHLCNSMGQPNTLADRVAFCHASCNFPVLSTWIKAVEAGFFTTFPGVTADLIRKFPPHSEATVKGHLDQAQANQRSAKPKKDKTGWVKMEKPGSSPSSPPMDSDSDLEISEDFHPSVTSPPAARTHKIYVSSQPVTGQFFSDPTGRFLTPSSRGHSYLLVVYDYDSNMVFAEPMQSRTGAEHLFVVPMQSRTGAEHLKAYKHVHKILSDHGLKPQLQKMDSKASKALPLQRTNSRQLHHPPVSNGICSRSRTWNPLLQCKGRRHPQGATPLQTDNSCAFGIANDTIKQRRSMAINMRFYWIKDCVGKGEFLVFWRAGSENDADYFTKHHLPIHHCLMRSRYLVENLTRHNIRLQRGCVDVAEPASHKAPANPTPSLPLTRPSLLASPHLSPIDLSPIDLCLVIM
jgi:hypothetical protein